VRFTIRHPAGEGERFSPTAFSRQIGRTLPLRIGWGEYAVVHEAATLAEAWVEDGGRAAVLTFDVPGLGPEIAPLPNGPQDMPSSAPGMTHAEAAERGLLDPGPPFP
jgi:hypothetical protein